MAMDSATTTSPTIDPVRAIAFMADQAGGYIVLLSSEEFSDSQITCRVAGEGAIQRLVVSTTSEHKFCSRADIPDEVWSALLMSKQIGVRLVHPSPEDAPGLAA